MRSTSGSAGSEEATADGSATPSVAGAAAEAATAPSESVAADAPRSTAADCCTEGSATPSALIAPDTPRSAAVDLDSEGTASVAADARSSVAARWDADSTAPGVSVSADAASSLAGDECEGTEAPTASVAADATPGANDSGATNAVSRETSASIGAITLAALISSTVEDSGSLGDGASPSPPGNKSSSDATKPVLTATGVGFVTSNASGMMGSSPPLKFTGALTAPSKPSTKPENVSARKAAARFREPVAGVA